MVSESVSWPVSMMIGALKPPLRSERTTSRPSVSGRPTSISTRSGELALAALAPGARVIDERGQDVVPGSGQIGMLAPPADEHIRYLGDDEATARTFREL